MIGGVSGSQNRALGLGSQRRLGNASNLWALLGEDATLRAPTASAANGGHGSGWRRTAVRRCDALGATERKEYIIPDYGGLNTVGWTEHRESVPVAPTPSRGHPHHPYHLHGRREHTTAGDAPAPDGLTGPEAHTMGPGPSTSIHTDSSNLAGLRVFTHQMGHTPAQA